MASSSSDTIAMRAALLDEPGHSDEALAEIDASLALSPKQSLAHALGAQRPASGGQDV